MLLIFNMTIIMDTLAYLNKKKTFILMKVLILLAGLARFELAHARVKVWCLTAWLQSNIYWGGRWDSNPRSPVPQTGALTNYATSTMAYVLVFLALLYFNSFNIYCQPYFEKIVNFICIFKI